MEKSGDNLKVQKNSKAEKFAEYINFKEFVRI
jgi:hypothetical protein